MRFPNSFLDDIRERLRISEVVGTRVTFDKKKTNAARGDYWACCPFHGEKTPSFHCEDRKGRYHCFGCGVSGDHFRFLTELDGVSFPEAVELLAAQVGLPMPVMDKREQEREEQRASLYDVMAMATGYFQQQLQGAAGARARAYLRDRGMSGEIQLEFAIGYAPDSRNGLKEYLAAKGVGQDQIEACGLVVFGSDIPVSYDRFRDRIMFPIPDSRGRVIAFGGRAMKEEALAKYLNSPETELFHKSRVLFNFARARKPAHDQGQVIVAEGYMDVIALHAAGFTNAVAPLGTALGEQQMELLWRMHDEPILCFDGDEAGVKAAYRTIDMVLPNLAPGRSVRFARLPEGLDPDDLIRERGPSAMAEVLEQAVPLSQLIWERELSGGPLDTPERRAQFERNLRQTISQIRDEAVRKYYGLGMGERLKQMFDDGGGRGGASARSGRGGYGRGQYGNRANNNRGQYGNWQGRRGGANSAIGARMGATMGASASLLNSALVRGQAGQPSLRETVLVMAAYFHPVIVHEMFEEFSSLLLENRTAQQIHTAILEAIGNWQGTDEAGEQQWLVDYLKERGHEETLARLERALRDNRVWQALPEAAFDDALSGWKQTLHLHLVNRTLKQELEMAERALAEEDSEENLERLLSIRRELESTQGIEALIDGFGVNSGRPVKAF